MESWRYMRSFLIGIGHQYYSYYWWRRMKRWGRLGMQNAWQQCRRTLRRKTQRPGLGWEDNIKIFKGKDERGKGLDWVAKVSDIGLSLREFRKIKIQINEPTRYNSFTSLLLDVYASLNMFRAPPRPSSGAYNCIYSLWFYRWSVVVAVLLVVLWPDHDQQHCYHHVPTVKPEAVNAVVSSWWWAWRRPKHVERNINVK